MERNTGIVWILQRKIHADAKWKQWGAYETRSRARESQQTLRKHYRETRIVREEVK